MDAAKRIFQNTALLLATALLSVAPVRAQSQLSAVPNPVALTGVVTSVQVQVNGSGPFTLAKGTGDIFYNLSTLSGTAPTTFYVSVNNTTCSNGNVTCNGQITMHPTSTTGGGTDVTLPVTFTGGSGGGTGGAITASATTIGLTPAVPSQTISLTNNNGSTVSGNITASQSWITLSGYGFTLGSGQQTSLTIGETGLSSNATGTVTITPTTGGAPTTITVNFTVSGGTSGGSFTVSPSTINLAPSSATGVFCANGVASSCTLVISSTATSTFNATVAVFGTTQNWLLINGNYSPVTGQPTSSGLIVSINPYAQLPSPGSGQIVITNPNNSNDSITVTVNVNGGSTTCTTGYCAAPTSLSFSAASGASAGSQTLTVTVPTGVTFGATLSTKSGAAFATLSGTNCTITSGTCYFTGTQTLTVTASAAGLSGGLTYTNYLTLQATGANWNQSSIPISLAVSGSGGGGTCTTGYCASPTSLTFSAAVGSSAGSQTLAITVPTGVTFQITFSNNSGVAFDTVQGSNCNTNTGSCTFTGSQNLTVSATAAGLPAGYYTNYLILQASGANWNQSQIPINITVTGSGGGGTCSGNTLYCATPNPLQVTVAPGGTATQNLAVTVPSGASVQATLTNNSGYTFATISGAGCTAFSANNSVCFFNSSQSLTVSVSASGLPSTAQTYTNYLTLISNGNTISVPIQVTVSASSSSGSNGVVGPTLLNFAYPSNNSSASPQQIVAVAAAAGTFTATVRSGAPWLSAFSSSTGGPAAITVTASLGQAAGSYTGYIDVVTQAGTYTVQANLVVSASPVLQASPGTVSIFNYQSGQAAPTANFNAYASDGSNQAVTATTQTTWLSISGSSSGATPFSFSLQVNPAGLCNGLNLGSVTVTGGNFANNPITVPVTVLASGIASCGGGGGSGNITVDKSSLSFSAQTGASAPSGQTVQVSSTGSTAVNYTYTTSASWLSASVNGTTLTNSQSLSTPTSLTVNVNPSGLSASSTPYTGTITLSPLGGTAVAINVSFTVTPVAVVSATPTSLTFTYNVGDPAPSSQTVQVTGASGAALTFSATAAVTSGGNWLSASPASGTTPASVKVSVNPTSLGAGTYLGTIAVAGTGSATGSTTINITLTVAQPLPTITSVANAGSYVGGSISPGEIITIFGTAIGPTPYVTLALDSTGKVATSIGGVQVIIGGFASPMVFASATQVSAVVPYEIAVLHGAVNVLVKYLNQSSNAIPTQVAATAPGIFTGNASGTGPAAILNANGSTNSPSNQAAKGETVAVYLTGEGQTNPSGVSGKVTTVSPTPPLTPAPLLAVGVLVDGQPVAVTFAGEAPGLVSGAMQINFTIPANARSGDLSLVVSIGGVVSQTGVTVSVK